MSNGENGWLIIAIASSLLNFFYIQSAVKVNENIRWI